ncbi:MAG: hypothetical protein ACN0LA_06845 [Candidatus Longimicrobiales bacterium M2_2A_002]
MDLKTRVAVAALAALTGVLAGCGDEPTVAPLAPPAGERATAQVMATDRIPLREGIVHYTWELAVGTGEFDVVRLHRIVKERRPGDPVRTVDGVFLLPGAPNGWAQIFVEPEISAVPPWDRSVAIHLAQAGIDVWGIDYAWARVPLETADFGFMEGWGVQRDIDHEYAALATARSIRTATGQGNGPLHLLGFSYGGPVGYGLLGLETQLPPGQRMAKGFVAVDTELLFEDADRQAAACESAAGLEATIADGTYENSFAGLIALAGLAETAPDEPSPAASGLTNREFILFATANGIPHFVGGTFSDAGIPTGLRFTDPALWIDVIQATRPYWPLQAAADMARARCGTGRDVAFDDHLGEITVPILYVGAAGGAGLRGTYTASLTATRDYRELLVQRLSDDQRMYDFGHADLFTATDADSWVWQPILDWLVDHRENRRHPDR